jgi:folate-dependent tRNA-U54 methylase TrmFO/GidA
LLKNYSQYIPKNEQSIRPINITYDMVTELKVRYQKENKVSKTYCELKMQSIIDATESIQQAIGKRPRP